MVRWKLAALVIIMVGIAGLATTATYFAGRVLPGVTVAGRPVGGLAPAAAQKAIEELARDCLSREIELRLGGKTMTTTAGGLGLKIDSQATLARAWSLGRTGIWRQRLAFLQADRRRVEPMYRLDREQLQAELKRLGVDARQEPLDARLEIDNQGNPRVVPARAGWQVDTEALLNCLATSPPGQVIDIPLNYLEPHLTTAELTARRIEKAAGSFTTFFNPAETDRTHNIRLASATLDGLWLPPAATLSFNEVVGPRTAERGYREALVIEERNYVPGIGGGVCQVSSTLYNAALVAGLTISERQPHGLPVGYVPPGRDATVAYGLIDLKIRNDSPFWYWLKTRVENDKLEMTFYAAGEAPTARVESQVVERIPPQEEVEMIPSWPPTRVEVKQEGKPGFRTRVTRIIYRQDKEDRQELVSQDLYPPLPRIIRRGKASQEVVPGPGS